MIIVNGAETESSEAKPISVVKGYCFPLSRGFFAAISLNRSQLGRLLSVSAAAITSWTIGQLDMANI